MAWVDKPTMANALAVALPTRAVAAPVTRLVAESPTHAARFPAVAAPTHRAAAPTVAAVASVVAGHPPGVDSAHCWHACATPSAEAAAQAVVAKLTGANGATALLAIASLAIATATTLAALTEALTGVELGWRNGTSPKNFASAKKTLRQLTVENDESRKQHKRINSECLGFCLFVRRHSDFFGLS